MLEINQLRIAPTQPASLAPVIANPRSNRARFSSDIHRPAVLIDKLLKSAKAALASLK
jgi:hypothetical protein